MDLACCHQQTSTRSTAVHASLKRERVGRIHTRSTCFLKAQYSSDRVRMHQSEHKDTYHNTKTTALFRFSPNPAAPPADSSEKEAWRRIVRSLRKFCAINNQRARGRLLQVLFRERSHRSGGLGTRSATTSLYYCCLYLYMQYVILHCCVLSNQGKVNTHKYTHKL